jgi:hypothetical protein
VRPARVLSQAIDPRADSLETSGVYMVRELSLAVAGYPGLRGRKVPGLWLREVVQLLLGAPPRAPIGHVCRTLPEA